MWPERASYSGHIDAAQGVRLELAAVGIDFVVLQRGLPVHHDAPQPPDQPVQPARIREQLYVREIRCLTRRQVAQNSPTFIASPGIHQRKD